MLSRLTESEGGRSPSTSICPALDTAGAPDARSEAPPAAVEAKVAPPVLPTR
eukprot:CAMPEP_0185772916 /NCGR_PEP_ID=MMETSP1174-20130828/71695_1 /TAXON_ID=35687 /ORGANISM="Dictyocha speculum, Strain CCMP1381" /LENGTH=51 /DNA_ID=CAMNT_0028459419 /DNA_START=144 /DNA_END=296 /DNA_ORIENTATION=-